MNSNRAVVIDRWVNKDGKHTARYGVGMRWRARFVDDQGKELTKAFACKVDARAWLDDVITRLGTGSYTDPEAGRATIASVYAAWSAAQAHISTKTAATRRSAWGSRVEPAWGDVAVLDVRSSAIRAWVAQLVDEGAGMPIIENSFGLLRQVLTGALKAPLIDEPARHSAVVAAADAQRYGLPAESFDPASDQWRRVWELWTRYFALGCWPAGNFAIYEGRRASHLLGAG